MWNLSAWLGKGDDRGWDGWMASPTRWTWVWVNSGSWWWTGRPGVLQFMGSPRVGHDWVTELNWTEGSNLGPLHWKCGVLITGPPGKFLAAFLMRFWNISYVLQRSRSDLYPHSRPCHPWTAALRELALGRKLFSGACCQSCHQWKTMGFPDGLLIFIIY